MSDIARPTRSTRTPPAPSGSKSSSGSSTQLPYVRRDDRHDRHGRARRPRRTAHRAGVRRRVLRQHARRRRPPSPATRAPCGTPSAATSSSPRPGSAWKRHSSRRSSPTWSSPASGLYAANAWLSNVVELIEDWDDLTTLQDQLFRLIAAPGSASTCRPRAARAPSSATGAASTASSSTGSTAPTAPPCCRRSASSAAPTTPPPRSPDGRHHHRAARRLRAPHRPLERPHRHRPLLWRWWIVVGSRRGGLPASSSPRTTGRSRLSRTRSITPTRITRRPTSRR